MATNTATIEIFQTAAMYRSTFIESGTYHGDGVALAVKAGFTTIMTVDIKSSCSDFGRRHQKGNIKVDARTGTSADIFPDFIRVLDESNTSAVFWLDGHTVNGEDPKKNPNAYPLLLELNAIAASKRNDHIIIIDDIYHMRQCFPDVPTTAEAVDRLKARLLQINPDYAFDLRLPQAKYKFPKILIATAPLKTD